MDGAHNCAVPVTYTRLIILYCICTSPLWEYWFVKLSVIPGKNPLMWTNCQITILPSDDHKTPVSENRQLYIVQNAIIYTGRKTGLQKGADFTSTLTMKNLYRFFSESTEFFWIYSNTVMCIFSFYLRDHLLCFWHSILPKFLPPPHSSN